MLYNKETPPGFSEWYSGKVALVTGATSGIGKAIAKQLCCYGAKVLLCGRDTDAMNLLLQELKRDSLTTLEIFYSDFSHFGSLQELISKINAKYEVDILVNNAGFGYMGDFYSMPKDKICSMPKVNLLAVVDFCQAFLPKMVKKPGTGILNIGSTASFFPTPGSALYCGTKYFILGFTDSLHQEMLSFGVHITGLYPGNTKSRFLERSTDGRLKCWNKAMVSLLVAKLALKGLSENKIRVIPGLGNKIKVFAASFIPTTLILKKVYSDIHKYY